VVDVSPLAPGVDVFVLGHDSGSSVTLCLHVNDFITIGFCAFDAVHIRVIEIVRFQRVAVLPVSINIDGSRVRGNPLDRGMIVPLKRFDDVSNRGV